MYGEVVAGGSLRYGTREVDSRKVLPLLFNPSWLAISSWGNFQPDQVYLKLSTDIVGLLTFPLRIEFLKKKINGEGRTFYWNLFYFSSLFIFNLNTAVTRSFIVEFFSSTDKAVHAGTTDIQCTATFTGVYFLPPMFHFPLPFLALGHEFFFFSLFL